MPHLLVGSEQSEYVKAELGGRPYLNAESSYERNLMDVVLELVVGPIQGSYKATWSAESLPKLRRELEQLYDTLGGEATFRPDYEGSLELYFKGDGIGHISIRGEACANASVGPWVRFELPGMDQTFLPPIIDRLAELEAEYPLM
jgi:hypothetical protein